MTQTQIEITLDAFHERYPLRRNHLNPAAGWAIDETGCLFETYGQELAFVKQQDPATIWTLVDGDDGDTYLVSGFRFVNRIGYLLSTVAVPQSVAIQVRSPMEPESGLPPHIAQS